MIVYLSGFLIVFHFNEWFMVWLGLEVNMLGFLILVYDSGNSVVGEVCYSYFFVQSLGSGVLLGLMYLGDWCGLMSVVLWLSMGIGPFFFWYVDVMGGLMWWSCYVLMSLQSIIPLVLLAELGAGLVGVLVVVSLVAGAVGSFGQVNVSMLVGYSSVQHMGWVCLAQGLEGVVWVIYFVGYAMMMMGVVGCLRGGISGLSMDMMIEDSVGVVLAVMNMGGVPPMVGFFVKWLGLYYFVGIDIMYCFLLLLVSVIMVFVYLRVIYGVVMGGGGFMGWVVGSEKGKVGVYGGAMVWSGLGLVCVVGMLIE